jgi:hypothetical protein
MGLETASRLLLRELPRADPAVMETAMSVRQVVEDFVELGPLPDSRASEETIGAHQTLLARITPPLTGDEAAAVISSFGPDYCYGLAWTLLHLIESAPGGVPIKERPPETANAWIKRLWARSHPS